MKTLEQIQKELSILTTRIDNTLRAINNADNPLKAKSQNWGKHHVNIFIRLDELSCIQLEKQLPKLKQLLTQFKQLRDIEDELSMKAQIEQHINLELYSDIPPARSSR